MAISIYLYLYLFPSSISQCLYLDRANHCREITADDIMFPEKGQQLASEIGATYYETSVLVPFGIQCTFTNCIRAALCSKRSRHLWRLLAGSNSSSAKHPRPPEAQRPFLQPRPKAPEILVPRTTESWLYGAWAARERGHHCDVRFTFDDGTSISAHRAVLICMCSTFRRIFLHRKSLPLFTLSTCAGESFEIDRRVQTNIKLASAVLGQRVKPCDETIYPPHPGTSSTSKPSHSDCTNPPRSSPYLEPIALAPSALPPRCPTDHLPRVDVVSVHESVSPQVFLLLLRYLYTDVYTGEHCQQLEILARNLFIHDFADQVGNWNYFADNSALLKSRKVMRNNNYSVLLLDYHLFAGS